MDQYDTYRHVLTLATQAAHADMLFRFELCEAHGDGRIDIDTVRRLMQQREGKKPSRATAYRRLEQWYSDYAQMKNPGRGA